MYIHVGQFRPFPKKSESGFVKCLLSDMLKQVKKRMQCNPNDYLRLNLRHPSLDSEIWYEFTQSKKLNEATVVISFINIILCYCSNIIVKTSTLSST